MRPIPLLLCCVLATLLLAGCGGGERMRVFPPTVSVQQLVQHQDGRWHLRLRLQNFSNVGLRFDRIEAQLMVAGHVAGRVTLDPMLEVPRESADIVEYALSPAADASAAIQGALSGNGNVGYTLSGHVSSTVPERRRDEFTFSSRLSAVPGLSNVLR